MKTQLSFGTSWDAHNLKRAIALLSKTSHLRSKALDPEYAANYSNLGNTLAELDEFDAAEEAHKMAIKLDPTDAPSHNNLGAWYDAVGRHEEALQHFQKAHFLTKIMHPPNITSQVQIFKRKTLKKVGSKETLVGRGGREKKAYHSSRPHDHFGMGLMWTDFMFGQNRALVMKLCLLQHSMSSHLNVTTWWLPCAPRLQIAF